MADQADVELALAQLATGALYPAGGTGGSAVGTEARIFRGWPNAAALDADLAAGRVNVTIFAVPGAIRVTTRYPPTPQTVLATPSLRVTVTGSTATFTGGADPGQLAGLLVEGRPYAYRTGRGDTPSLVAAILAAAVARVRPARAAGTSVTTPGAALMARVAADATATTELRRQVQTFRVTAWCPTPAARDSICTALDSAFAATPFLTLADGSSARLTFATTTTMDQLQDAALYRRDILYTVEYPTTLAATQPSMLFGTVAVGADIITA